MRHQVSRTYEGKNGKVWTQSNHVGSICLFAPHDTSRGLRSVGSLAMTTFATPICFCHTTSFGNLENKDLILISG